MEEKTLDELGNVSPLPSCQGKQRLASGQVRQQNDQVRRTPIISS